jgi:ABC-type multidrug transport system ATPase subunit
LTAPAIAARGLEKRFGFAVALAGIDLVVAQGSTLAVLGPNGAGKSTLLRLFAGLTRPSGGSVEIAGRRAHGREARARVGLIGHDTFLYPALTARENLVFAGRLHGVAHPGARADALLAEAGLAGVADRPVGGFSRGMAQRLAIARGLVHDPAIVLLDEPFTGLDRRAAERLAERLARLRDERRTVVLVTHDVASAARLADAAIVLARGRVAYRSDGALAAASLEGALAAAEGA